MILAGRNWNTNADLIADVAALHLDRAMYAVDVTYGRGVWWQKWKPDTLVAHDLNPTKGDGVDFTALPEPDDTYDLAAFDPNYVSVGGRKTSTVAPMLDRYGMDMTPKTPAENQDQINAGLAELYRVLRPTRRRRQRPITGVAIVKCMDYVTSGRLFPGAHHTLTHALGLGFELLDRFEHIGHVGPQPTDTRCVACAGAGDVVDELDNTHPCDRCRGAGSIPCRQMHARRNLSTLFILTKGTRP